MKNFAQIAKPLNELLQREASEDSLKPNLRGPKQLGPRKPRESVQDQWTLECEKTFRRLKESLTEAPVLAYADPLKPYELHVDASRDGVVLYQESEGKLCPIAYVSCSLTPHEKNYLVHKLEFLALKWTVVDKLRDYLCGATFVVKTDNNPLTYL